MRYIALSTGDTMGDSIIVFNTNTPQKRLKQLELFCAQNDDPPIWKTILESEGYIFGYVDEHQNVTAYGKATEWLSERFPGVELYEIAGEY